MPHLPIYDAFIAVLFRFAFCFCHKQSVLEFPDLFLNLPVFKVSLFFLFYSPFFLTPLPHSPAVLLLYVSPLPSSLSSYRHCVYMILRVDRRTLGNLLLRRQTFIFLCLIHQSAPCFVFDQRGIK